MKRSSEVAAVTSKPSHGPNSLKAEKIRAQHKAEVEQTSREARGKYESILKKQISVILDKIAVDERLPFEQVWHLQKTIETKSSAIKDRDGVRQALRLFRKCVSGTISTVMKIRELLPSSMGEGATEEQLVVQKFAGLSTEWLAYTTSPSAVSGQQSYSGSVCQQLMSAYLMLLHTIPPTSNVVPKTRSPTRPVKDLGPPVNASPSDRHRQNLQSQETLVPEFESAVNQDAKQSSPGKSIDLSEGACKRFALATSAQVDIETVFLPVAELTKSITNELGTDRDASVTKLLSSKASDPVASIKVGDNRKDKLAGIIHPQRSSKAPNLGISSWSIAARIHTYFSGNRKPTTATDKKNARDSKAF